jgi:hypothetical protein
MTVWISVPSTKRNRNILSLVFMIDIIQDIENTPELLSPFDQLREVDADGKEWWNSRKLARVMGYGKYWNFERVIAKAQACI